jgi:hypothetical protein
MIFLPLYRSVAQSLSEGDLPEFFDSATVPQLAAVLSIQTAQKLADEGRGPGFIEQSAQPRYTVRLSRLGA